MQTTLSALTAKRLRDRFRAENIPVVALFITKDIHGNRTAFIEDFLAAVYHQLDPAAAAVPNASLEFSENDEDVRKHRIEQIRQALYSRLSSLQRAFLVLDDVDKLSSALDLQLNDELLSLQERGLAVTVTSRLSLQEPGYVYCDVCKVRRPLTLFWECQVCQEIICCYSCKEKVDVCEGW
jgi:hypothetical protein